MIWHRFEYCEETYSFINHFSVRKHLMPMASQAKPDVPTNPYRKELYVRLWDLHRCDGSSLVGRWKLVDEGFLNHYFAHFEKVRRRIGSPEEEVLEAIMSMKKATGDARKSGDNIEPNTSGITNPERGTLHMIALM